MLEPTSRALWGRVQAVEGFQNLHVPPGHYGAGVYAV